MASWQRRCSSHHARKPDPGRRRVPPVLALALLAAGCGRADERTATADPAPAEPDSTEQPLCIAASEGSLRAKLQGAIEADIDWGAAVPQCRGGVRPQGDGVRLIYKGPLADGGTVLVVLGIAPLRPGESARNVPANLTVVREGSGQFFSTQGDGKCSLDEVRQSLVAGDTHTWRLEGRGFCTQPARALDGDGSVLLSWFDVVALVTDTRPDAAGTESAR